MSMQACSLAAIDFGLPGAALADLAAPLGASLAASAGCASEAASFGAALDLLAFGLTCTRGLSPTFGGSLVCAMAAAEYSTAASTRIFFMSLRFRRYPTGWKAMGRLCARLGPNGENPAKNGFPLSGTPWRDLSTIPRSPSPLRPRKACGGRLVTIEVGPATSPAGLPQRSARPPPGRRSPHSPSRTEYLGRRGRRRPLSRSPARHRGRRC